MISLDLTTLWVTLVVAAIVGPLLVTFLLSRTIRTELRRYHDEPVMQMLMENKVASEKIAGQLELVQHLMGDGKNREAKP